MIASSNEPASERLSTNHAKTMAAREIRSDVVINQPPASA
jgi:hypothetical protein